MSIMTNYLEEKLIDHLFAEVTVVYGWSNYTTPSPASWFIGLHTGAFGETGSGGVEVTLSAGNYARIAVARGSGFTKGSSSNVRTVENAGIITFGIPSSNWGQVTHVGIWDHVSNTTNLIIEAQLQFAKTINNGDPAPKFNAGELKFTFD